MATLYELTDAYNDLFDAIMGAEPGDDIEALMSQLDAIDQAWDIKADNYAKLLREADAHAEAAKAEAKRLTARAKRCEALTERLTERMKEAMKARGLDAAETSIGTWKFGKGRERVEIVDATAVPEDFLTYPDPVVSKTAIMDEYKRTGMIVPGTNIVRGETFGLK